MFGISTQTSVPQDILNSQSDGLASYMAAIWHSLFTFFEMLPNSIVIEVASGSSPKIGLALSMAHFTGTLYIVDPCESAIHQVIEIYRECLAKNSVKCVICPIDKAVQLLPKRPHFLVANHPLDDMLISTVAGEFIPDRFNCFTDKHKVSMQLLESDPERAIAAVHACWQHVIDDLQPLTTIISQYPSLTLRRNGAENLNKYASKVLRKLKQTYHTRVEELQPTLNQFENFSDSHIGCEVLNAANWIALKK